MDRRAFFRSTFNTGVAGIAAGAAALVTATGANSYLQVPSPHLPPVVQPPIAGFWRDRYLTIPGGTPAPQTPFSSGQKDWIRLQDFAGRPTLVTFWATWCQACVGELPVLNDMIGKEINPTLLNVVTISIDQAALARVNKFMRVKGWTNLAHFQDQSRLLFGEFGSGATPTAFLMDRHSRIIGGLKGMAHWRRPESLAVLNFMQYQA